MFLEEDAFELRYFQFLSLSFMLTQLCLVPLLFFFLLFTTNRFVDYEGSFCFLFGVPD